MKLFQKYLKISKSFESLFGEDFRMSLFFKFGQAAVPPEVVGFLCWKKGFFFRQDLKGTYISRMAPKREFFLQLETRN